MYKLAGRFHHKLGRKGAQKRNLTIYDRLDQRMQFSAKSALTRRLDAEAASATPSLRKKSTTPRKRPIKPAVPAPLQSRVYLVRFVFRNDPRLAFIKIGISATSIASRFAQDARNYEISLLSESAWLATADALAIETAIHDTFRRDHFRPPVPLATGNTECYQFSDDALARMLALVSPRN